MTPAFDLVVQSFTSPTLPGIPSDLDKSAIRSPHIANALRALSPLDVHIVLPHAKEKNPLHPATHLNMEYFYDGTGAVMGHDQITADRLECVDMEQKLFLLRVPPEGILRVKVNHGESADAEVRVCAFKDFKLLDKWVVGQIKGLGLEGFKSEPIHLKRVEQWKQQNTR